MSKTVYTVPVIFLPFVWFFTLMKWAIMAPFVIIAWVIKAEIATTKWLAKRQRAKADKFRC